MLNTISLSQVWHLCPINNPISTDAQLAKSSSYTYLFQCLDPENEAIFNFIKQYSSLYITVKNAGVAGKFPLGSHKEVFIIT